MAQVVRANTIGKIQIGPVVAFDDGLTPVAGLDPSTADEAEGLKQGATSVTSLAGFTLTAIGSMDGYYNLITTTALTDTLGNLTIAFNDDDVCLPVRETVQVVSELWWDDHFTIAGSGAMISRGELWRGTFAAVNATTITAGDDTAGNAIYVGARVVVYLTSGTNSVGRGYFGTMGASRVITLDPTFQADAGDIPTSPVGSIWVAPKSPTSSVPTAQLADGHLVTAKFGADFLTNALIADDAFDTEQFVADFLTNALVADGVFDTEQFAADFLTNALIADNALAVEQFKDACLTAAKFATAAITAAKIGADAITSAKIADDAIGADQLAASAATKIIDDFETQSQADPTGFHVNTMEVNSVDLTGDGDGTPIGAA